MKTKLERLQSRVKELQKEQYNSRKVRDYHSKGMKDSIEKNDLKSYEKHNVKHQFHTQRLENCKAELRVVREQIKSESLRIEEESYRENLRTFDTGMTKKLSRLQGQLRLLADSLELKNIVATGNDIYDFYTLNSKQFRREDLTMYAMLGMLHIKIVVSHLTEEFGERSRIVASRNIGAGAQKASNLQVWSRNLASQIEDCLSVIKKRSERSTPLKEKAKKFLLLF